MTLAEGIGGTEDNFADIMNKRAAELGMTHSHFANARGKADPSQYVTAHDMALLAAHVIRDDQDYYHYFGEKEFTWNRIRQLNRNPLLTMNMGADGLKAADPADGGFGAGRLGGSGRAAPDRRDVRAEVSDRTRGGGAQAVRLRLPFLRPPHRVRGRPDGRGRVPFTAANPARSPLSPSAR